MISTNWRATSTARTIQRRRQYMEQSSRHCQTVAVAAPLPFRVNKAAESTTYVNTQRRPQGELARGANGYRERRHISVLERWQHGWKAAWEVDTQLPGKRTTLTILHEESFPYLTTTRPPLYVELRGGSHYFDQ